jgi:uncharacterized protein YndB with AHSA1/START domain
MPVTTDVIERTIHINAKPETVFAFLTDARLLPQWMGRSATLDPRPGGIMRVDYDGFDVARGQYLEVVPNSRVVFTWGWESLADSTRPGASTVTVTLAPEGDGTRLMLVHEGLSEMDTGAEEGWEFFLGRLATRAAGGEVEHLALEMTAGRELAARLNMALCEAREVIEKMPAEKWTANTSENRALNALASHLADHIGVIEVAQGILSGTPGPFAGITLEQLDASNAERDRGQAQVGRDEVLAALCTNGPQAVEAIKAMSDEDLAASMPMAFAGSARPRARHHRRPAHRRCCEPPRPHPRGEWLLTVPGAARYGGDGAAAP